MQLLLWQCLGQLQSWERKRNGQAAAEGAAQLSAHSLPLIGHDAQKYSPASLGGKRIEGTCIPHHSRTARLPAQEHLWWPGTFQMCTELVLGTTSCRMGSIPQHSSNPLCLSYKPQAQERSGPLAFWSSPSSTNSSTPHFYRASICTTRNTSRELLEEKIPWKMPRLSKDPKLPPHAQQRCKNYH